MDGGRLTAPRRRGALALLAPGALAPGALALVALLAGAGCRDAVADAGAPAAATPHDPRHGIDVPGAWTELTEVAAATEAAGRAALGAGDHAVHAHAWGEPSRGCYLAIVELHGAGRTSIRDLSAKLVDSLAGRVDLGEWTTSPDAEDRAEMQARFTADPGDRAIEGLLRAELRLDSRRAPHAVVAACFHNDRQPAACESACAPLLAMLAPLTVPVEAP